MRSRAAEKPYATVSKVSGRPSDVAVDARAEATTMTDLVISAGTYRRAAYFVGTNIHATTIRKARRGGRAASAIWRTGAES
jgi:hypothetical protein